MTFWVKIKLIWHILTTSDIKYLGRLGPWLAAGINTNLYVENNSNNVIDLWIREYSDQRNGDN